MYFLHNKSVKIHLLSDQHCTARSTREIKKGLEILRNQYEARKLEIPGYHGNNKFGIAALNYFLQPLTLHIYDKGETIGTNEILTGTLKECIIYTYNLVPYRKISKLMTEYLVELLITWLNDFLSRDGISLTVSLEIVV